MTIARNFPERKNTRRKAALARIGSRRADTPERNRAVNAETLALYDRIVPSARDVRTKKLRGGARNI